MCGGEKLNIEVVHRAHKHFFVAHESDFISYVQNQIYEMIGVRPSNQKLLAPHKARSLVEAIRTGVADTTRLKDVGAFDHMRLTLIGAPDHEVEEVQMEEARWDRSLKPSRSLHPSMLKVTRPHRSAIMATDPVFNQCAVHPSTPKTHPFYTKALEYLERLASDPAILHICHARGLKIGKLTELLPHENPELLGLNVNKGESILLRIRTDAADGMRDYKTTRRVLIHELCHNEVCTLFSNHVEISDHSPEFKILNSQLNREVDEFERKRVEGTHYLSTATVYEPVQPVDVDVNEEREERRLLILHATEKRLAEMDQELESQCGGTKRDG